MRGAKAWLALSHGCVSSTKVRSSAAAVTATTVPPAAGTTVSSAAPVEVARTTAYDGWEFGLPCDSIDT